MISCLTNKKLITNTKPIFIMMRFKNHKLFKKLKNNMILLQIPKEIHKKTN